MEKIPQPPLWIFNPCVSRCVHGWYGVRFNTNVMVNRSVSLKTRSYMTWQFFKFPNNLLLAKQLPLIQVFFVYLFHDHHLITTLNNESWYKY